LAICATSVFSWYPGGAPTRSTPASVSAMLTLVIRASTTRPSIISTASPPIRASVVAAFFDFGFLNAGTPFEIASTPVRAADPEENALASRKTKPMPVMLAVPVSWKVYSALSAAIGDPIAQRIRPVTSMARMEAMNA